MTKPSYLAAAIEVAKEAGAVQLKGLGKTHDITYKGEINLVTNIDRACEQLITEKLQGYYPDHDILAEEGGGKRKNSEYKWIVDPLDGTTNYAHGYPLFCTSIALEYKSQIVLGVVYEPNRDELFYTEIGNGCFLNGKKIRVSKTKSLKESLLATGFAYNIKQTRNNNIDHFGHMLLKAQAVRRDGVAAIDLCYVACGRFDGFWELNLFPWDVAAGSLIVREAGGLMTNFTGKLFSVYDKEILSTNGLVHHEMQTVLETDRQRSFS